MAQGKPDVGSSNTEGDRSKRSHRNVCRISNTKSRLTDSASNSSIISRVKAVCSFPNDAERARIISGLRWIGLLSTEKIKTRGKNLLDTLCAQLEILMKYEEGERDFVMLQHKFVVEWKDGKEVLGQLEILREKLTKM